VNCPLTDLPRLLATARPREKEETHQEDYV